MDIWVSLAVPISMIVGVLLTAFVGWSDSGEDFDPRKFFSTLIAGIMIALPIGAASLASNTAYDIPGLILACVNGLMAGWAIDFGQKKLTTWHKGKKVNTNG